MHGFVPDDGAAVLRPAIPIEDATRDQLVRVVAAIQQGATPEEVSEYFASGFPEDVDWQIDQPLEQAELSDHVDVFVAVMQAGAVKAAA